MELTPEQQQRLLDEADLMMDAVKSALATQKIAAKEMLMKFTDAYVDDTNWITDKERIIDVFLDDYIHL